LIKNHSNIDFTIFEIDNVYKTNWGSLHSAINIYGKEINQYGTNKIYCSLLVDSNRRKSVMRNHTVTHLLHKALTETLGEHVQQAGSFVSPDYLRFDFSHHQAIPAKILSYIEKRVNDVICSNIEVEIFTDVPIDEAKDMGAKALFEDKYSDKVRVVKIGEYSTELCGGTHSPSTGFIQQFIILKEEAAAAGVRRIEAVTGSLAYKFLCKKNLLVNKVLTEVNVKNEDDILDKIAKIQQENKELLSQISEMKQKELKSKMGEVLDSSRKIQSYNVYGFVFDNSDIKQLREKIDQIRQKDDNAVILFGNATGDKAQIVCGVSKELSGKISAKTVLSNLALKVGGSAGGRDDFAQGGAKDIERLKEIIGSDEELNTLFA